MHWAVLGWAGPGHRHAPEAAAHPAGASFSLPTQRENGGLGAASGVRAEARRPRHPHRGRGASGGEAADPGRPGAVLPLQLRLLGPLGRVLLGSNQGLGSLSI